MFNSLRYSAKQLAKTICNFQNRLSWVKNEHFGDSVPGIRVAVMRNHQSLIVYTLHISLSQLTEFNPNKP